MQEKEFEFQKAVKRLKTEIKNPDFTPFKQVSKPKFKKTRISKKPLEYLGSGIGSASAQYLKNSKPILKTFSPKQVQAQDKDGESSKNGFFLFFLIFSVVCGSSDSRLSLSTSEN